MYELVYKVRAECRRKISIVNFRLLGNQKDYIDRRGIHVVVGHYIGDSVDPLKTPNITKGNFRNIGVMLAHSYILLLNSRAA